MGGYPISSQEAAELREREAEASAERAEAEQLHRERCQFGWLVSDEPGFDPPCPVCRPATVTSADA